MALLTGAACAQNDQGSAQQKEGHLTVPSGDKDHQNLTLCEWLYASLQEVSVVHSVTATLSTESAAGMAPLFKWITGSLDLIVKQ